MASAWLLTALACAGVLAGIFLSPTRKLSGHLAAAGGGMLLGIAVFWLAPEMKALTGWTSLPATVIACAAIVGLDRLLVHSGHSPRQGVIVPLLLATAAHSFVDGWSLRAFATQPLTDVAVPVGLALHKIPEGAALGWVARHLSWSPWAAALVCFAVEGVTLAGAWIEPRADRSGIAAFGPWWTAGVLAVISGSFLFLAIHAILPAWKRPSVVLAFLASLFAMAAVSMLRLFAV